MHTSTLLTSLFLTQVFSLPTTDTLSPRACAVEFPSALFSLDQKAPTTPSGPTLQFRTLQSQGGNGREAMEVLFTNVPANAYGCQLEIYIPAGTPLTQTDNSQINTFVVDRDASAADTWANAPAKRYLLGTSNVYSDPTKPVTVVVNSFACKATLSFRVELASQTAAGSLSFGQQNPPSTQPVGFRLTHNC